MSKVETISEAIKRARRRLGDASDSPRLDAELLLCHVLDASRSQLLARLREQLTPEHVEELDALTDRRAAGEPVAYIVGYREFYGRRFAVSPAVLVPRPETELLVEWALGWLVGRPDATVVDVGTGSGAIAVSIAAETPPSVRVVGIDVSAEALDVVRANADELAPGRIEFLHGDLLEPVVDRADLVLANLPYLRTDQIEGNRDLIAEPRLALDGGDAGLELIYRLVDRLPLRLAEDGAVALEIDPSQGGSVADRLRSTLADARVSIHPDLAGQDRFVTAVRI